MADVFPSDWRTALVLVPHPDDPEYGCAAAVAKWTAAGKTVHYALASRGEAGVAGMAIEQAGPLREQEQRRSAAVVGVADVRFWEFPDGAIRNSAGLRAQIVEAITEFEPDVVISVYGGPEWAPGAPNQRDHMEFAAAVVAAHDSLPDPPRWLFQNGPELTHAEVIDDACFERAVASLAEHKVYLSVLDPGTPVTAQARKQVELSTPPRPEFGGRRAVGFIQVRP
ncbi:PIG-L family deacetylase [Mycolicibacterium sp. ND9-15]|uniref:PIG-L deacetylase family protein n=1 Tax=Mycolicibacterium sp. ND9-15 TaxID=3042320 RepID=UPI002DDC197E|nr:PIG-L family deacetylase [Mycolicibacterium sp. ND9-15]WSE57278.1 PIG-L family deacetylase [Mycolicibacterium sp. ND9-15]